LDNEPNSIDLGSVLCYNIGVESRKEKDMNEINERVANYESHLRDAEKNIEQALQAICSLGGSPKLGEVRKSLGDALGLVQFNICGTYQLYDNPEIKAY
jgi:hypothetical protein